MEALLLVLGAVVGALATGGVAAWGSRRQRCERRRVAARVILGDLYVLKAGLEVILEAGRWPDGIDLQAMIETWRGMREALASGVAACEWALVHGVFSTLHRVWLMVRLSETLSQNDRDILAELLRRIPRAQDVVLTHATVEREREQLATQLRGQGEAQAL
ncbi:MAG: hypothetical protein QOJ29_2815 [Thermoleophilaceae bacterium]|nr:hypothetical protein [Thermoleophilaceae bacterium]